MNIFAQTRFDCFVIWGHGQKYLSDIISEIRKNNNFEILHLHKHEVKSIKKLVYQIYSFDYAPLFHLKAKVKYLESTPPVINFIFIKNKDAQEEYFGTGDFRHKESLRIKRFKDLIRERFNPRGKDGNLTHDHVIHATDNESQTDAILKLIGYPKGVHLFTDSGKVIKTPHYIIEPNSFTLKEVTYDDLYCANAFEINGVTQNRHIPIKESAQYLGLSNPKSYQNYLQKFSGQVLKQDYDLEKYLQLKSGFSYLQGCNAADFVVVTPLEHEKKMLIVDGLHRASIHLYQGNKTLKVCVI